jgi:hypothetical protein
MRETSPREALMKKGREEEKWMSVNPPRAGPMTRAHEETA